MKVHEDRAFRLSGLGLALAILLVAAGCGAGGREQPSPVPAPGTGSDSAPQIIDLANATCPVMGGRVAEGAYFDWQGYRVHICCGGCENSFVQDPSRFIPALLRDDSIDPAIREGLRQHCESSGIDLALPDSAASE